MSINSIITLASTALSAAQSAIATSNANIADAGNAGATQKVYQPSSQMTAALALDNGTISRTVDTYLLKSVISNAAASGRDSIISSYMDYYDSDLGTVDGGTDISSLLNTLQSAMSALSSSPDDDSAKSQVINAADAFAKGVNALSGAIQGLRTQANNEIADTVTGINKDLTDLDDLNQQISQGTIAGTDVTTLEDKRDSDLQNLSSMIGISYFTDASNKVVVYTSGGESLVGFGPSALSYTPSGQLDGSAQYPGAISGIMLNGVDITSSASTGKLGGLISLRDKTLVSEQQKLDQLARSTIATLNGVSNQGSAFPAPNSLASSAAVASTDAFPGSGTVRVAVVSSSGSVASYKDLDLSSMATVGDLVTALNGISGLNATIGANGTLTLSATNSGNGVSLNNLTSAVGSSGAGFSQYFGFNNLFAGADASTIAVTPALAADPSRLPGATLSSSASLALGDGAISASDNSVSSALLAAFTQTSSFPASGDFAAKTESLTGYAGDFVSRAATLVSNADAQASTSKGTLSYVQSALQNQTGVNTDEELALVTQYQNEYEANAQLITIARSLFQDLITMVS